MSLRSSKEEVKDLVEDHDTQRQTSHSSRRKLSNHSKEKVPEYITNYEFAEFPKMIVQKKI